MRRSWSGWLVVGVAVLATAAGILSAVARATGPSLGAVVATGTVTIPGDGFVVEPIPGASTPLQAGDVVVGIARRPMTGWLADELDLGSAARLRVRPGDVIPVSIVRAGRPLEIAVPVTALPAGSILLGSTGTLVFVVVLFGLGAFVFARRPTEPAARGLLLAGVGAFGSTVPFVLGLEPLDIATGIVRTDLVAQLLVYLLLWGGALDFALNLPRPIAAFERRPWLAVSPYVLVYALFVVASAAGVLVSSSSVERFGALLAGQYPPILVSLVGCVLIGWRQYRRSTVEERRAFRGVAIAGAFTIVGSLLATFGPEVLFGRSLLPWSVAGLIGLPLPLALAAAILRHRAFEIDLVVRRSLVYTSLTVLVAAIYVGSFAILQRLAGGSEFAASLLATGIAAIVALPLRDALQLGASRLLFGDRDEPHRAILRLGERLERSIEPADVPDTIVQTVAESLRLPYAALAVGEGSDARSVAVHGRAPDDHARQILVPLTYGSEIVGRLIVAQRTGGEPLTAADMAVLEALARQAGVAVHAVRLTLDLLESRSRLITAREEERRRIRRDLHDGLGPTLAAIGLRAEAAAAVAERDPAAASALLGELHQETQAALADIRRLVDALRPPVLDELGLVGALRAQAALLAAPEASDSGRVGPSLIVDAAPVPTLPAAVEVAAYRIAVEAMTNAVRHARASRCEVRLSAENGLTVEVVDDGHGIGEPAPGIGLSSMRARALEVGGQIAVETRAEGGTRVVARLPLAAPASS